MDAIGAMRHRLTFQEPSGLEGGGYEDVLAGIPAKRESLSGAEALRFGGQSSSNLVKWTIRYRADILPAWRLRDEIGRYYQILTADDPKGLGRWTEIFTVGLQ